MRYFVFVDNNGYVMNSLASNRVPGDGGPNGNTLPPNCIELPDEETRSMLTSAPGYKRVNNEWVAPVLHPTLDTRSFFMLFTPQEISAMNVARVSDTEIDYFWTLLTLGTTVNLGHPLVTAGLSMLVNKGLLTTNRANAIAAGNPPG